MPNIIKSQRVQTKSTIHFALQHPTHNFGITNPDGTKGSQTRLTNNTVCPSKSACGLYYLECRDCGRVIFSDGTGSASNVSCGLPWRSK